MPIKTIPLADGNSIPWVGFGTGTALFKQDSTTAVLCALGAGFTHLDSAQVYNNEEYMGAAILQSSVPREHLFVTTKLGYLKPGETVEDSIRFSLEKLQLSYVDLFLIHVPAYLNEREGGLRGVWREMVGVKEKGLARSVGVSNFSKLQLQEIVSMGIEKPAVNQIEYHPLVANSRAKLLEYAQSQGIVIESYGGLAPIMPSRSGDGPLEEVREKIASTLDKLAATRGKDVTRNQILLKWLETKGVAVVTTSSKESRLKEYLATEEILDLTLAEQQEIMDATGGKHYCAFPNFRNVDEDSQVSLTSLWQVEQFNEINPYNYT